MSDRWRPSAGARRISRRQALSELGLGGASLILAGCGLRASSNGGPLGSTLASTYVDPLGDGVLQHGPGAPLIDRTELTVAARPTRTLATLAHLSDAHLLDAQSPARVPFLRRLGPPFNSTFRPQEALTAQVMNGALRSIGVLAPDAVIQGGDLIDNAQRNELQQALDLLAGRRLRPGSGAYGYFGVQSAQDPNPFYYRPDVDAPRHPGLLQAATQPIRGAGLTAPWHPVLGDHDTLVQGVLAPTPLTRAIATGARAVWDLPAGLHVPHAFSAASSSPDGLRDPGTIEALIAQASAAPSVAVAADPAREQLGVAEILRSLRAASGSGGHGERLDYGFDVGAGVRVIVLDLVRREGGSGGLVHPGQDAWLAGELARAAGRRVLVVSHQPIETSEGGSRLLALLDREPGVVAALSGHTHRNRITPRPTRAGGYWLIATSSLIDHPQELRALRLRETESGGVVLETWMLDHAPDGGIGDVSRALAYLDVQGGRPQGFAGGVLDRNVRLYKR